MENIRNEIYSAIADQFPEFYRTEGDFLISFIEAYYKHNDAEMDRDVPRLRDIDTTLTKFLVYYKKKYLADLPLNTEIDVRFIIKHIRDMYNRKGTEESLQLLFRLFFDEEIEISYPSNYILRPSDSIWGGDTYLEMLSVYTVDDYPIQKGMRIRGDISLSTAFVDEVIFVNFGGALSPIIYVSNVAGSFTSDDSIVIVSLDSEGKETTLNVGKLIQGSTSHVTVDANDRKANQEVGTKVKIVSSLTGVDGEGRVTATSTTTTGSIDFDLVDGGFGYVDPTSITASNTLGISNQVLLVNGMNEVDVKAGDELYAIGDLISYTNPDTDPGTYDYAVSGSAKVIEYRHPLIFVKTSSAEEVLAFASRQVDVSGYNLDLLRYYLLEAPTFDAETENDSSYNVWNKITVEGKYDSQLAWKLIDDSFYTSSSVYAASRNASIYSFYTTSIANKADWALNNMQLGQDVSGTFVTPPFTQTEWLPTLRPEFRLSGGPTGNDFLLEDRYGRMLGLMSEFDIYPKLTIGAQYEAGYYNYSGQYSYINGVADSDFIDQTEYQLVGDWNSPSFDNAVVSNPDFVYTDNSAEWADPNLLNRDLRNLSIPLRVYRQGRKISTAPVIQISGIGNLNSGADFEVSTLTNVETVSLITDQIGDFSVVQLDADGIPGNDDYGMSGPGAENISTPLQDAFSSVTVKIGSIASLKQLSAGQDYQNDVAVSIVHDNITKFNKKDVIVTFENANFSLESGDIVTQARTIPDIEINQAGNITESEVESLGTSTTGGGGYRDSTTTFEYTSGNTIEYTTKARFLKRVGNSFYFRLLSFYGFDIELGILISGALRVPSTIVEDPDSLPMGANADIRGRASYESGQIESVAVTKTGYKYTDNEQVDIVSLEPSSPDYNTVIAKASIRTLGQGKTDGRWQSSTSFLSDSTKRLHDNNYYQEYSYDISSIVDPDIYKPLIDDTVGVAGTKLFSTPLINSINTVSSESNVSLTYYDITSEQLLTYDGDQYVAEEHASIDLHADIVTETGGID